MARRGKTNFKANTASRFPTNGTGLIGADRVRQDLGVDIPDSFINNVDDLQLFTVATGTNSYALAGMITAYASGYAVFAKFTNASTGACELNINSIAARKIYINPTTQADIGDIPANHIALLIFDATLDGAVGGFLMLGSSGNGSSLLRVSLDVSGSTPTMDLNGAAEKVYVGNGAVAANKEFLFNNITNFVRATTFITVTGTRSITVPANVITNTALWTWTKPSTKLIWAAEAGVYRLEWFYDGTSIYLDIYGLYTNVI